MNLPHIELLAFLSAFLVLLCPCPLLFIFLLCFLRPFFLVPRFALLSNRLFVFQLIMLVVGEATNRFLISHAEVGVNQGGCQGLLPTTSIRRLLSNSAVYAQALHNDISEGYSAVIFRQFCSQYTKSRSRHETKWRSLIYGNVLIGPCFAYGMNKPWISIQNQH
jgi:hypothetical protein